MLLVRGEVFLANSTEVLLHKPKDPPGLNSQFGRIPSARDWLLDNARSSFSER